MYSNILCVCLSQEFKEEHGHTNVPQEYYKNPSLGNWVKYNRKKLREWYKNDSCDDIEKMTLLIEIGMVSYIGECCIPPVVSEVDTSSYGRSLTNSVDMCADASLQVKATPQK